MNNEFWQMKWKLNDTKFHEGKPNHFLLKYIKNLDSTRQQEQTKVASAPVYTPAQDTG